MQVHRISVEFDERDPAQIAFFANFFRWHDAASRIEPVPVPEHLGRLGQ